MVDVCFRCNRVKTGIYCLTCISKLLQPNWTSGNKYIDKFIKEAQLKVNSYGNLVRWYISSVARYRNLLNCEDHKIAKEKDVKSPLNKNEKEGVHVALKSLKNSSNISDDFLNELKNHLHCLSSDDLSTVRIFGITQDPETSNYMIVMELMNGGNLRSNLLIKKYNPLEKYYNLMRIANALRTLHECNIIHDICKGLRPEIFKGTLPVYARLMKRCWDSDPNKRPTADELYQIIYFWYDYLPKCYENDRVIPSNEQITKNHPLSCYTSRKIDYSAKINEILSQEELSTKIVIDEKKGIINDITLLSENLENFRIPD
ncbi:uncharacterized protein OCT59_027377 [Rhizophagus irregularis]|nr:hypothetical protein OCT59_027377 [Rhizophagus irregularis]